MFKNTPFWHKTVIKRRTNSAIHMITELMNAIRAGLKAAPAEHESLLTRGTMHAGLENWFKPPMDVKYFHDQWKRKLERFNF